MGREIDFVRELRCDSIVFERSLRTPQPFRAAIAAGSIELPIVKPFGPHRSRLPRLSGYGAPNRKPPFRNQP